MFTKAQLPAMAARRQARLRREKFYMGSPCSCGLSLRYTSTSGCVECTRQRSHDRYIPVASQRAANVSS